MLKLSRPYSLMVEKFRYETLELILLCILLLQLFCGILLFSWGFSHSIDLAIRVVLIAELPLIVTFFLIFVFARLLMETEYEREREENETRSHLERSLQLIQSLQALRHDFRNHLQVIRALAAIGKSDEIQRYVDECGVELDNVAYLYRLGNPVLEALFLAFQGKMREFGIGFTVECSSDLYGLAQPPVKLSRVFSNILQNAIEAVSEQRESPYISVNIWNDESVYHFVFRNNGPSIPPEDAPQLFTAGFTQKPGMSRGYGLYTAKTLTSEMGGTITLENTRGIGVSFHVTLPANPGLSA